MSRTHTKQGAFGDAVVVVVTFTTVGELRRYVQWTDIEIPALLDPDRSSYRAYGVGSASAWRVWGLKNLRQYLKIFAGRKLTAIRKPTEDTRQLGADMVIDRNGDLAWAHWPEGPDDRPTIQELVDAVRACD
ncbi:MAG: AhpC/TSA family protein [Actinomycetota bacterium]